MTSARNQPKRRRRPRKSHKQNHDALIQAPVEALSQPHSQDSRLRFKELVSESTALERQMAGLHNQLKQTVKERQELDSKAVNNASHAVFLEQMKAIEEELSFVRKSLQTVYGDLLLLDLPAACDLRIEEKLWRNAIYPVIEDIRGKIRKNKSKEKLIKLEQQLASKIRQSSRFYRKTNSSIRQEYHIDTATIGIHLFRNDSNSNDVQLRVAKVLQHNFICMGDLERYNAVITSKEAPGNPAERSYLAKTMYLKAIDIYRSNGKPYSQLALISINGGSAIDVVWYYCMSMAMKEPAAIAFDNLKSFYAKVRFSSTGAESISSPKSADLRAAARKQVARAVEKFLTFQREVMYGSANPADFPSLGSAARASGSESWQVAMEQATRTVFQTIKEDPDQASSLLKLLRSTLMRITIILITTIWYLGRQQKGHEEFSDIQVIQRKALIQGCLLHTGINTAIQDILLSQDQAKDIVVKDAQKAIVTATSIWACYLATNIALLTKCCSGALSTRRQAHVRVFADEEAESLMIALSKLLSVIMSLKPFTPANDRPLPSTLALAEDYTLLGLLPLEGFHKSVDFLKEAKHDAPATTDGRTEVRWYRIYDLCQRLVESGAFGFISFDAKEQKYTIYDKESRKQQQTRLMKALAAQRLMEQVSTLETSLGKMTTASEPSKQRPSRSRQGPLRFFTVVLDVTAFLDGLACVRRWAGQGSDSATHLRGFICEVIVPLDTIDALDEYKKGTSHANAQARESIRYLDHKLESSSSGVVPTAVSAKESFLRTQRVTERLSSWDDAQFYWIGEQQRSAEDSSCTRLPIDGEDEDEVLLSPSDSDDEDTFLNSRLRRRRGSDDSDISDTDSDAESDVSEPDMTYTDVPKGYRSIISCLLYYHSHQPAQDMSKESPLILATNDQDLAWWVSQFGDPQTGKQLATKRVDEWDRVVRSKAFL
ncbi:unnamed protein product [Umbelopsis ramanniana]